MRLVSNPVVTHLLAQEWFARAQVPKPTALGTPLRYSSAYGCARQQGYAALGAKPTEPMDEAGAWVTGLGTLIHEALQEAIGRKYPQAQFEVASGNDYISGSCDAYIPALSFGENWTGGDVLYELKTMGTYSFDDQVGWNRMKGTFKDRGASGPAMKAIAQAGMNALGLEKTMGVTIGTIIMGSIGFEALSKNKAANMGVDSYNRFLAEFHINREEWEPLALAEIARMETINETITNGYLPARVALDDDGHAITLTPGGRNWQCDYCSFKSVCANDGDGLVYVNESYMEESES